MVESAKTVNLKWEEPENKNGVIKQYRLKRSDIIKVEEPLLFKSDQFEHQQTGLRKFFLFHPVSK